MYKRILILLLTVTLLSCNNQRENNLQKETTDLQAKTDVENKTTKLQKETKSEYVPILTDDEIIAIQKVFATYDKNKIAKLFEFPFGREYPLEPIKDEEQFLKDFETVLDKSIIDEIVNSDPKEDWSEHYAWGANTCHGLIWINDDKKIYTVNRETEAGIKLRKEKIEIDKKTLPPELRDYDEPVLKWETENYFIRVDVKDISNNRLIVFNKKGKILKVLNNGRQHREGNCGDEIIDFENGDKIERIWVSYDSTYTTFLKSSSEKEQLRHPLTEENQIKWLREFPFTSH